METSGAVWMVNGDDDNDIFKAPYKDKGKDKDKEEDKDSDDDDDDIFKVYDERQGQPPLFAVSHFIMCCKHHRFHNNFGILGESFIESHKGKKT